MTRSLVFAVAIMFSAGAVAAAPSGRTYVNARFGYVLTYPASLVAEREADNGDGRVFHPRDGGAGRVRVWAAYNALEESPDQIADQAVEECQGAPVAYRVAKAGLVAVSCAHGGEVFYQKTLIRGDVVTTLQVTYPAAERGAWEPMVKALAASLRPAA